MSHARRPLALCLGVLASALLGAPVATAAAPPETRLAVVVTATRGVAGEEPLRYADAEGQETAAFLLAYGGVRAGDLRRVPDATVSGVTDALRWAVVRASEVTAQGGSVELVVYYTGHGSSRGLHLSGEAFPLDELKAAARVVPSARRLFVIDACQSGAIARSKGATLIEEAVVEPPLHQPPEGELWLTSSGPEEQSFEVDRRRGALFTHYFLSGARGAADSDGDRRVTLTELHDFVARHTTTEAARAGQLQRPRLAGDASSFVVSDLRVASAGVRFEGPVARPSVVVERTSERVVAEMPVGAGGFLALEPGAYDVITEAGDGRFRVRELHLGDGDTRSLSNESGLGRIARVRTKGGALLPKPWTLGGGYRLALGSTPGRADAHGGWLAVRRELGRGHLLSVSLDIGGAPFRTDALVGSNLRVAGQLGWTHALAWRSVWLGVGARLGGGWLRQFSERRPDPVLGEWFGDARGHRVSDRPVVTAQAEWLARLPARSVELQVGIGAGAQVAVADKPRVSPLLTVELGLAWRL